jgi:GH15 family glucan-1,4-alpha-glucosidase
MTAAAAERSIAGYALIGDCETAALVGRDGSLEWLCWPRFDSEACFAAMLGDDGNGHWRLCCADEVAQITRRYLGDSLILETTIEASSGAVRIVDFMPVRGEASDVVRIVIGESGSVRLRSELRLRFDFGRLRPRWLREDDRTAVAISGPHGVRLASEIAIDLPDDGDCFAEFTVSAGEQKAFILTYFISHGDRPAGVDASRALEETRRFWVEWTARCIYKGAWREAVMRSLIVMKALTYRPSGAIVAAPTSSLPEKFGGGRNWDYRFCWLRDATFTLLAFLQAGYPDEAKAWRDWLLRAVAGDPACIQPVYGLGGEARLTEWEADWLTGFEGSIPVRFGNAAFQQRQFDVYGEVIDVLHQAHVQGLPTSEEAWRMAAALVEHLELVWREPDNGIWETRDQPKRFTYSQAMIWAGLDRLIHRAQAAAMDAPLERWKRLRADIHAEICQRGFDAAKNTFVRDFDSHDLDASLLLLPQIGFLPADDPRVRGTIEAIGSALSRDGFIIRYDDSITANGLPKGRSAFLACSFWYADALVMIGRRAEAEAVFERVLAVRNDLGLMSEKFDVEAGTLVGNFPQALSHLALVNTAFNLAREGGPAGCGIETAARPDRPPRGASSSRGGLHAPS